MCWVRNRTGFLVADQILCERGGISYERGRRLGRGSKSGHHRYARRQDAMQCLCMSGLSREDSLAVGVWAVRAVDLWTGLSGTQMKGCISALLSG